MVRVVKGVQNFAAGELSPRMRGRYDLPLYQNGSERLENFIVETQGPARYRTGFKYVTNTYQDKLARLIPFVFNDEQSYIFELTNERGRIISNGGLIIGTITGSITAITNAASAIVTSASHGLTTGDEVFITEVEGMTELNNNYYTVTVLDPNSFSLNVNSTGFGTYTSGGTFVDIPYFDHPYLEAELFEVRFAQQADTMYLVHRNHEPRKLQRVSNTEWNVNTFTRTADPFTGPDDYPGAVTFFEQRTWYAGTNNEPQSFWFSQSSNFDNLTTGSGATDGFKGTLASKQTNVVHWIEANDELLIFGSNGGNKKLSGGSGGVSPTNITILPQDFLGAAAIAPVIKDKRIIFAQQDLRKIRVIEFDFETDSFEPADLTKLADQITLGDVKELAYQDGRPDVVWAVKEDGDLVGLTYDPREKVFGWHRHKTGREQGDKFLSIEVDPQVSSEDILYACIEREIDGTTRRMVESLAPVAEIPEAIQFFTGEGNKESDLETFKFALLEAQKEYFHVDSGLTFRGDDQGSYVDLAALTGDDITLTSGDPIFSASSVGREIWQKNGPGRAEIIAFTNTNEVQVRILVDFTGGTFLDPVTRYQAGEYFFTAGIVSGLQHLEGREVAVVTDGAIHPNRTVSNGSISLDYQASVVHVGLSYTGTIKSMNLEAGGMNGPAHGKQKNIHKIDIRFYNTLGASYGEDIYNMSQISFRSTNSFTNSPPELFSGIAEYKFLSSSSKEKNLIMRQDQPLPCTIQYVGVSMTTGDM